MCEHGVLRWDLEMRDESHWLYDYVTYDAVILKTVQKGFVEIVTTAS